MSETKEGFSSRYTKNYFCFCFFYKFAITIEGSVLTAQWQVYGKITKQRKKYCCHFLIKCNALTDNVCIEITRLEVRRSLGTKSRLVEVQSWDESQITVAQKYRHIRSTQQQNIRSSSALLTIIVTVTKQEHSHHIISSGFATAPPSVAQRRHSK